MSKVVLITGVSSGFGKSTAELLAANGHIVYGTVRKECAIAPSVKLLQMDLMDPISIKKAVDQVIFEQGRIDVLINNAGMHLGGPIEEAPEELFKRQLETNIHGLVYILQATLPYMRRQNKGVIVNFSSIGGLMGLPFQPFYSASKFAIEGLSESLRMEVKSFHIRVVVINPGDFATSNTANRTNIVVEGGAYDAQFRKSQAQFEKDEINGWDPLIMAKVMLKVVESRRPCNRYIVASFEQKLAIFLKRVLPISWFAAILGSHYKL